MPFRTMALMATIIASSAHSARLGNNSIQLWKESSYEDCGTFWATGSMQGDSRTGTVFCA